MSRIQRLASAIPCLCAAAACSEIPNDVALPRCGTAVGPTVNLAVGEYAVYSGAADSGCLVFPANAGAEQAEYLVTMHVASGVPGAYTTYALQGGLDVPAMAAPPATAAPTPDVPRSPGERLHEGVRALEAQRGTGLPAAPPSALRPAPVPPVVTTPPVVGEQRSFSVCASLNCALFTSVSATARRVGDRLAIFVDNNAPADGLNDFDLDTLIALFDDRLYAIDVAAFGGESDVNNDGVVIMLMTGALNRLVTDAQCRESGFVVGYVLGLDIDPAFATDGRFNHAEVFYSLVADPNGTLSCPHSRNAVKFLLPPTFVHEFQHLISYNQHVVVRGGNSELLWLNEALSHYAEELGGDSYLVEGDMDTYDLYLDGNLHNTVLYFAESDKHFLFPRTGIGSLAERGGEWTFLRYVLDQYAADTSLAARNAFTRALVETPLIGAENLAAVGGASMTEMVTRWALAFWSDDLPGVTTPPELQYQSWNFRDVYARLNGQEPGRFPLFPLAPVPTPGEETQLEGILRSGSPVYHMTTQPPGGGSFTLRFGTGYLTIFNAGLNVRVGVVRVR
jgi:hypothetical protein